MILTRWSSQDGVRCWYHRYLGNDRSPTIERYCEWWSHGALQEQGNSLEWMSPYWFIITDNGKSGTIPCDSVSQTMIEARSYYVSQYKTILWLDMDDAMEQSNPIQMGVSVSQSGHFVSPNQKRKATTYCVTSHWIITIKGVALRHVLLKKINKRW